MERALTTFNRFMSNFSTKLVGGFVPVIVYNYVETNKMQMALLTLAIQYLLSFILDLILEKQLIRKPQLFTFLRVIPIIIYEILLLFVGEYPVACVLGIGIAFSCSYTFKHIPKEALFAYVNAPRERGTGKHLAKTKLVGQMALIIGTILGGVALDYLNMTILIVISIALYLVGALPLIIYHILHKKDENRNQEYSTSEHIALKTQSRDTKRSNVASKKIVREYCWFYFLQESYNAMYILLPLLMFTITGTFTTAAIASALFDGVYGVGCYFFEKLDAKRDLTNMSMCLGVLLGIGGISLIFIKNIIAFYLVVAVMALCYSLVFFFSYHRMLMKSKIVGRNIHCVINKINMYFVSTTVIVSFGIFLPIWSCFLVGGVMSAAGGLAIPYVEEKTRRILVDHIEDNEIREDYSIFSRK
ncbi:MAG: MFS transporter [Clostridiales bacterium]|nr:MFS transporter [Clostridiales bacterium]